MKEEIEHCTTCFMTSRFPGIRINQEDICNFCLSEQPIIDQKKDTIFEIQDLNSLVKKIKEYSKNKYDCIIGISGGLDSSYVAYLVKKTMGLNPLLVYYDHGFNYHESKINRDSLVQALNCDFRELRSTYNWDKKYVGSIIRAFSNSQLYWGICGSCQYILNAAIAKIAFEENIHFIIKSSNAYEEELHISRKVKLRAILKAILKSGITRLPYTVFHLIKAQYYLLRLKLEFYIAPVSNLYQNPPKTTLESINLTKYFVWDINNIQNKLMAEVGWKPPEHPNLGMRFDCMIEDSFINHTYESVTGSTVHSIIASNLIYDKVATKNSLEEVVNYYQNHINERIKEVKDIAFTD